MMRRVIQGLETQKTKNIPLITTDSLLREIRHHLRMNAFVYVPGELVSKFIMLNLPSTSLHPNPNPFHHISKYWEDTEIQRDELNNSIYPSKKALMSYYNLYGRTSLDEYSIEHVDLSTVHNVSNYRIYKAFPIESDSNKVLTTVREKFVLGVFRGLIEGYDYRKVEMMQSAFRTIKSNEYDGDASPEGVHQDNALMTAIFMKDRYNMIEHSGATRIWSQTQPCGKPTLQDRQSNRLLSEVNLRHPWDCLLLLDRKVKHEGSLIIPRDPDMNYAARDILTFEVRNQKDPSYHVHVGGKDKKEVLIHNQIYGW